MGLNVDFEYTSPGTPQYNGRVKRKFETLYGKITAIINGSDFNRSWWGILWGEAARTLTDNIDIQFKSSDTKDPNDGELENNKIKVSDDTRGKIIRAVYNPLAKKYLAQLCDS